MRNFVYVIGSSDDFFSIDELKSYWEKSGFEHPAGVYPNCSAYLVTLSEATQATGYKSIEEIATMIGRGEAMTDGWCLDDTLSFLTEEPA